MSSAEATLAQVRRLVCPTEEGTPVTVTEGFFAEASMHPDIEALLRYGQRTGHRIRIDYRNPHGRHTTDRPIVVNKVRYSALSPMRRLYVDATDTEQRSPRTFVLDRITHARLDGLNDKED